MEQVKELRARTGAGVVDAKTALTETAGDIDQAITLLRKKGKAVATKKADRATREGTIATYIHSNSKVGVMISLLCETDFVARNETFKELARNLALHIAAADPTVVRPEDVTPEAVAAEEAIALEQAKASSKPANIQEKIVAGKLKTFREEQALLTQPYVKDPSRTVGELIQEAQATLGENISVKEFKRFSI
ncbi:MAG: elongation factor Ts [Candidatus Andersenbacteria bacterium]